MNNTTGEVLEFVRENDIKFIRPADTLAKVARVFLAIIFTPSP